MRREKTRKSEKKKRADELDFPDTLLIRLGREFQGSGELRYDIARSDAFAERHHGDDPRCAIDSTKDTHGGKQRLPLLKLDLLRVISSV
jgi:hypothetical protein